MPGFMQRFPALGRLQATTLALRLGRNLGLGGGSEQQAWRQPRSVPDLAARRLDELPAAAQDRYAAAAARAGLPGERAVLERALAGGASIDAIESLARVWTELTDRDRRQVAAPLRPAPGTARLLLGDDPARQVDQTTCGSTVLAMLAAAGDPFLALWLVTGRGAGPLPPEVRALGVADRSAPAAAARFGAAQRAIKTRSNAGGLGPLPWPAALGTPPWGAARVARHPGARFRAVMIDDSDVAGFGALLDRADRSLAAGVPVPLFTGGDLASGPATALPRHVVLLTPIGGADGRAAGGGTAGGGTAGGAGRYAIFEPASGTVQHLTRADLLVPAGPLPALGGWSHVCWAVLPGG